MENPNFPGPRRLSGNVSGGSCLDLGGGVAEFAGSAISVQNYKYNCQLLLCRSRNPGAIVLDDDASIRHLP